MNLDNNQILINLFISTIVGAIIGLEREKNKLINDQDNTNPIGIRTDIIIALFGAVSAYLSQILNPAIFLINLIAVMIFLLIPYTSLVIQKRKINFKTELSSLIVFILGAMTMVSHPTLPIMIAILTTMTLSMKQILHTAVNHISYNEIIDAIKFIIISCVILPFLPNESYDKNILSFIFGDNIPISLQTLNVINPYHIWLIVVVISGIIFLGYILVRIFGKNKGLSLTGLLGGIYSSTLTSLTLSKQSKFHTDISAPFISGITLACASSFFKMFLLLNALNFSLFSRSLPAMAAMCAYLFIVGFIIFKKSNKAEDKSTVETQTLDQKVQSPFQLISALQFAGILTATLIVANVILAVANINWYYILAGAMAFFAVDDPIIISTAEIAGKSIITLDIAKNIIIGVISLNLIQKVATMYIFGNRKLVKPLALIFGGLLLVTTVGFLYL
jgi:uncharacterized membrane protein (DUF4010 family)